MHASSSAQQGYYYTFGSLIALQIVFELGFSFVRLQMASSWLCGYFIYQLFNPVLFAYKGAVVAGQMGMSLSLANALRSVAVSWINTKAAPFGALIIGLVMGLPLGTYTFLKYRRAWHEN